MRRWNAFLANTPRRHRAPTPPQESSCRAPRDSRGLSLILRNHGARIRLNRQIALSGATRLDRGKIKLSKAHAHNCRVSSQVEFLILLNICRTAETRTRCFACVATRTSGSNGNVFCYNTISDVENVIAGSKRLHAVRKLLVTRHANGALKDRAITAAAGGAPAVYVVSNLGPVRSYRLDHRHRQKHGCISRAATGARSQLCKSAS
jgi:hypothetical protein